MHAIKQKNRINGTHTQKIQTRSYSYEVTGTIHEIGEVATYKKDFKVRNLTLLDEEFNAQPLQFQLLQKDVNLTNGLNKGDRVKIIFRLTGRFGTGQWEGRTFTNLRLIKIQKISDSRFSEFVAEEDENLPF
jgi:hypothetical protein